MMMVDIRSLGVDLQSQQLHKVVISAKRRLRVIRIVVRRVVYRAGGKEHKGSY